MTTKEKHVLTFWYERLLNLQAETGQPVTAGQLARYVGQSRGTAQKYLKRLIGEKAIKSEKVVFPNKVKGFVFFIYHGGEQ